MAITTMNISLPAELARYVRKKVTAGLYSSASEVIREALRRLSNDEEQGRELRTMFGERYDRGSAEAAVQAIRELQKQNVLGPDMTVEGLIREGRLE